MERQQAIYVEEESVTLVQAWAQKYPESAIVVPSEIFETGVTLTHNHLNARVVIAKKNTSLQDLVTLLAKDNKSLQEDVTHLQAQVTQLSVSAKERDTELVGLRDELAGLQNIVKERDTELVGLRDELAGLQKLMQVHDKDYAQLNMKYSALQTHVAELQKECDALKGVKDDVTQFIDKVKPKLVVKKTVRHVPPAMLTRSKSSDSLPISAGH